MIIISNSNVGVIEFWYLSPLCNFKISIKNEESFLCTFRNLDIRHLEFMNGNSGYSGYEYNHITIATLITTSCMVYIKGAQGQHE